MKTFLLSWFLGFAFLELLTACLALFVVNMTGIWELHLTWVLLAPFVGWSLFLP